MSQAWYDRYWQKEDARRAAAAPPEQQPEHPPGEGVGTSSCRALTVLSQDPAHESANGAQHPLAFFKRLAWLDGRPLLKTIDAYRRDILSTVLFTFQADGSPRYNFSLCGRAKKNYKTTDLILAGLYRLLAWPSDRGNDCFILANDEAQAGDDLKLAKKLIACNPVLAGELIVGAKLIERKDGRGKLEILPAGDIVGAHGKTYSFCGFDEIHGYRNHDLFEALALDPTRDDGLMWITSYAGISHAPGVPLHDFMQAGKAGDDRRMFFSWYSGDFTTDPSLVDAEPEQRANPSINNFTKDYLKQQRQRLPSHKFRRLHLNLPGAPDGAAFDGDRVMAAVVSGRRRLMWEEGRRYLAGVDMCGGSNDDATLSICHYDAERNKKVQDVVMSQAGKPPFNPRDAVRKFAAELKAWKITRVFGDAYGGETFRRDFAEHGIEYVVYEQRSKSDLYEALEPMLNAGEVELVDDPKQTEQFLTLVWRGSKIDHQPGNHDDFANVAAIALVLLGAVKEPMAFAPELLARIRRNAEVRKHMGNLGMGNRRRPTAVFF